MKLSYMAVILSSGTVTVVANSKNIPCAARYQLIYQPVTVRVPRLGVNDLWSFFFECYTFLTTLSTKYRLRESVVEEQKQV